MDLNNYIKKHTFIFIVMLLIIIMILVYSFFLIDKSDFKDRDIVVENPLKLTFFNAYLNVSITNDKNDVLNNKVYISNSTNTDEDYELYLTSSNKNNLKNIYYKIDDNGVKKVDEKGLLVKGTIEKNTTKSLNIGLSTNDAEVVSDLEIKLK